MFKFAFKPGAIGNIEVKNRFVMAPVWMAMADDKGFVTEKLIDHYGKIASSGIGLIISEYAFILPGHQMLPKMIGIGSDKHISGLKKITNAVHTSESKIFIQIADCGLNSDPKYNSDGLIYGPSVIELEGFTEAESMGALNNDNKNVMKELTKEQIKEKIEGFGKAAKRAVESKFDGIELHGAHSYLISQFLSPLYNRRNDNYGGSLENRMRFLIEVFKEVKKNSKNLPISVRLNGEDGIKGGINIDETIFVAKKLEEMGVNLISISGGSPEKTGILKQEQEAYFADYSKKLKKNVKLPILLTGGIRSPEIIENLLKNRICDFIGLARPLIAEENLISRWASGDLNKAECISCNKCFVEEGLSRYVNCPVFE
jgi:2,4-dienoyl-CoA reductase-like NADH-dependent reductase (Old Yellow Enzyme family)